MCCLTYKSEEVCKPAPDCDAIFKAGNSNDAEWKSCCEKNPTMCPKPVQCYPDTVYTDPRHKDHKTCCEANPTKTGCQTECSAEIFSNVNHSLHEYCCEKKPDEPDCNKPIPCITECNEENDIVEEFYNKEGYVTMKGRMKKKTHQQLLNHIHHAKANASRHH